MFILKQVHNYICSLTRSVSSILLCLFAKLGQYTMFNHQYDYYRFSFLQLTFYISWADFQWNFTYFKAPTFMFKHRIWFGNKTLFCSWPYVLSFRLSGLRLNAIWIWLTNNMGWVRKRDKNCDSYWIHTNETLRYKYIYRYVCIYIVLFYLFCVKDRSNIIFFKLHFLIIFNFSDRHQTSLLNCYLYGQ